MHQIAQRIFTGTLLPEKVLIFTHSEAIFADPHNAEGALHSAVVDMAQSWVSRGSLTGLFGIGKAINSDSMMNSFDYIVPAATGLLTSNGHMEPRPKFFACEIPHLYDMELLTGKGSISFLENDERFSVLIQEAQAKAKLQSNDASNGILTPLATAVAKFQSTPSDQQSARHAAAVDAIGELLADLLFIPREQVNMQDKLTKTGIDSLVASELRKQLAQYFEMDISTGWLLGGDVTSMDIVESLCR